MEGLSAAAVALLLLLAPGEAHAFAYRFEKDMVYEDSTVRSMKFEHRGDEHRLVWDVESDEVLRRTILEVDETDHPRVERIEVLKFIHTIKEHPEEEAGAKEGVPAGSRFVWRRLKDRWGLFDGEGEVTDRFPSLVERLKNWRDARLPKEPVEVGGTWEVPAKTFLETVGSPAPNDVQGLAVFRLQRVEGSVATITFDAAFTYNSGGEVQNVSQKGTWLFDVTKGRDLDLESEGTIKSNNGRTGSGTFRYRRLVTYRP